jgi:hypothetical protein
MKKLITHKHFSDVLSKGTGSKETPCLSLNLYSGTMNSEELSHCLGGHLSAAQNHHGVNGLPSPTHTPIVDHASMLNTLANDINTLGLPGNKLRLLFGDKPISVQLLIKPNWVVPSWDDDK